MGIMTAENVKTSELRVKMRALQEKCCTTSVELPADMMAVVALAEQCFGLGAYGDKAVTGTG